MKSRQQAPSPSIIEEYGRRINEMIQRPQSFFISIGLIRVNETPF